MQDSYSTSQIADKFGLHPNTIRLYENWGVISSPERKSNGYRIYTDEHIKQIEIVRLALRAEVLQNGLRKKAIQIIQTVALREYAKALLLTDNYIESIDKETEFSKSAIMIVENILYNRPMEVRPITYTRQQAADELNITIDTLRNWELNGLLTIKRKENGYRIYNETDMQILKVIRELRVANYSLSAILRMLNALHGKKQINVSEVLNTPDEGEFIISVCDKLIVSLNDLRNDAIELKKKIAVL
jgi:DNA-binding transcriptional MerR regulator